MGKYTALNVQSVSTDTVEKAVSKWLATTLGKSRIARNANNPFPLRKFAGIYNTKPPKLMIIGPVPQDWIAVHYNSFYEIDSLGTFLSKSLDCQVVGIVSESVTDSHRIKVEQNGELVRLLDWSDGAWTEQAGTPLEIEAELMVAEATDDDEEAEFMFMWDHVVEFCSNLGLLIDEPDYNTPQWTIFRL